jgi:eukaryotic-like serine/threonine-protein kinase
VEAVLGRGAMGVIYRAHDPAIGRKVAIKLIRADLLDGEEREEFLARFQQEAQAAGRCTHPNIVTIHDFALHDGNPFLAMEYVEGENLAAALRRAGRFPPERAVAVLLQVLAALGAAHALGIVHRDVKPANILLLPDGRVKMTDFGIARIESAGMTQAGVVLGTPSYMSPEQCRGEAVDGRSDLFSAGAVLFELLSGERPFPGRTFTAIAQALTDPAPLEPGARLADQPPGLVSVVRRALAKRPEDRFASAEAMAAALRASSTSAGADAAADPPTPEATVLAGPADPPAAGPAEIDPSVLATIERRLADHVGPIARHLVREAARQEGSLEALCTRLGRSIERTQDRETFLASVRRGGGTGAARPQAAPAGLPRAVLDQVQQDLTRVLGPIARVLVLRAAAQGGSEADLRRLLASHIADARERAAFLGSGG